MSAFSSRFDYLGPDGINKVSKAARIGFGLFQGKGKCQKCHVSSGLKPLFTDYTYDSLGVPKNPMNPFYDMPYNPDGENWVDTGLGDFLKAAGYDEAVYMAEWGKQKVPTLRNVALAPTKKFIKAYSHNGYFKSLEEIVHFYNTRDVPGAGWPAPEVAANINTAEMGNLGLNKGEELAIVAFLQILSDEFYIL